MSRIDPNRTPANGEPPQREGFDRMALPHPLTFAAILGGGWKTYYQSRYDEARQKDPHFAQMMRNDSFLTGLMLERTLAVTSLPWHLEVDDENDPTQAAVRDHLTKQLKATPKFRGLMKSLQYEGTWYGRTAVQTKCDWQDMPFTPPQAAQPAPARGLAPGNEGVEPISGRPLPRRDPDGGLPMEQPGQPQAPPPPQAVPLRSLYVSDWKPVSGDKIGHLWDGTPTVLVNAAFTDQIKDAEFVYNDLNRAMVLRGSWRERFLIHSTWQEDSDFFDGVEAAEAVFGVGVRSKVGLWQWIRMEWIAKISDFMDRSVPRSFWYWELGNAASEAAVRAAALKDSIKEEILLPRSANNKSQGVEYLEASLANVASLMELVKHVEQEYIIPLVNGQKMSRDHTGSGGLGGSGAADMAGDTKGNITEDDAQGLAETLTGSRDVHGLVNYLQRHTFPNTLPGRPGGFPVRFVLGYVDAAKGKERLETIQIATEMVPVKADDVYKAAALSRPTATDELAQKAAPKPSPFGGGDDKGGGDEEGSDPPDKDFFAADDQGNEHRPPGSPEGGQFMPKWRTHIGQMTERGAAYPVLGARTAAFTDAYRRAAGARTLKDARAALHRDRTYRAAKKAVQDAAKAHVKEAEPAAKEIFGPRGARFLAAMTKPLIDEFADDLAGAAASGAEDAADELGESGRGRRANMLAALHDAGEGFKDADLLEAFNDAFGKDADDFAAKLSDAGALDLIDWPPVPDDADEATLDAAYDHLRGAAKQLHGHLRSAFLTRRDKHAATVAGWDPQKHPHRPAGSPEGGQFGKGGAAASADEPATAKDTPGAAPSTKPPAGEPRTPQAPSGRADLEKGSRIVARRNISSGINTAQVVELENGAVGVWKPEAGEKANAPYQHIRSSIKGPQWQREVAASKLADLLGLGDLVPATTQKAFGGGRGSLQSYHGGARAALLVKPTDHYDGRDDLARAAAFDFLTLNTDRHFNNWMLDGGKLVLIDNGLSFPDRHGEPEKVSSSNLLLKAMREKLPIPEAVKGWKGREKEVEQTLYKAGLSGGTVQLAVKRLRHLIDCAEKGQDMSEMWHDSDIDLLKDVPRNEGQPTGPDGGPK